MPYLQMLRELLNTGNSKRCAHDMMHITVNQKGFQSSSLIPPQKKVWENGGRSVLVFGMA